MSTQQDLEPKVRVWLHERLTDRPDPYPVLDEVLSRLPSTPQRRSRWWRRGSPVGQPEVESRDQTSPGRFSMSSALKFIAASVVVAVLGGFLLAGLLQPQGPDGVLPAAASESPSAEPGAVSHDAAVVSGRIGEGRQLDVATISRQGNNTLSVGARYQMELTEMDDPRLNGTFESLWNQVTYDGIYNVVTATNRIENEDGSWVGVERGYRHPRLGWNWQGLYEGTGAYEGLSALLFWSGAPGNQGHGVIFPGAMPDAID